MTTTRLYSLSLSEMKTYLIVIIFAVGNLLFPQICHQFNLGGQIMIPIFFFTLIAAYKYGLAAGILTAIISPLANHLLFGMPPASILPEILIKSVLLAVAAATASRYAGKISFVAILLAVLSYQFIGTAVDTAINGNLIVQLQQLQTAVPGLLFQIFGGYMLLKAIRKI